MYVIAESQTQLQDLADEVDQLSSKRLGLRISCGIMVMSIQQEAQLLLG